jgi:hypothetical protein
MRSFFQCKCDGGKNPKKVTSFGCKNGGFPYCANSDDFFCNNGNGNGHRITRVDILSTKLTGNEGCICPDGFRPTCQSTGEEPKCPDGSEVDYSFGKPGKYFTECQPNPKKKMLPKQTI